MAGIFRSMMESGALQRLAVVASILVHVGVLGWLLFGPPVKLFGPSASPAIDVELVSPDELERKQPEQPKPPAQPAPDNPPPPQQATQPDTPPKPAQAQAQAEQKPAETDKAQDPAQQMPATFGAPVAEPDVTAQYGTLFQPFDPGGYDVLKDKANLKSEVVAAFRNHLKSCSIKPAGLSPSDDVRIVMRIALRPDGTLEAPPALVEAKASPNGPLLMQAATKALQACQPYTMLPADKYNEWKVLDLDFTPADFAAG